MEYPEQPRAYEKRGRAEIERCGRTAGPFGARLGLQHARGQAHDRAGRQAAEQSSTMVVQITAAVRGSASMRIAKMMEPAAKLTLNRPQIKPAVTTARTTSRPGHADAAATVAASVRG